MYPSKHIDPIILSQNSEHVQAMINEENPLNIEDKEL